MRTELEVTRIELWSLFKVAFFLYAALGLVIGLVYGFFLLVAGALETAFLGEEFPRFGVLGGVVGLVLIPVIAVFYGAIGSAFVTIGGLLYNLVAGVGGGLRLRTSVELGKPQAASDVPKADESPPTIS